MYYHQGRPFELAAHGDTRSLLVSVPWPAVNERLPGADALTACRLAAGTPYARLASAVLRELLAAAPTGGSAALDRIGASAIDILVAAVEGKEISIEDAAQISIEDAEKIAKEMGAELPIREKPTRPVRSASDIIGQIGQGINNFLRASGMSDSSA